MSRIRLSSLVNRSGGGKVAVVFGAGGGEKQRLVSCWHHR